MPSFTTDLTSLKIANGSFNYLTANLYARLVISGTPAYSSNVMTGLTAANNAADLQLTSKTVTVNGTSHVVTFGAANLVWTGLHSTANASVTHIVVFDSTGVDSTSIPAFVLDVDDLVLTTNVVTSVTYPTTSGIGRITG